MSLQTFIANGLAAQRAVDEVIADSQSPSANGTARARTLNPTCFLNREACRDFLLEQAAGTRHHKFERVSSETLHQVNEVVRQIMIGTVRRLPSKGKTI
jgi:hypothetical protein